MPSLDCKAPFSAFLHWLGAAEIIAKQTTAARNETRPLCCTGSLGPDTSSGGRKDTEQSPDSLQTLQERLGQVQHPRCDLLRSGNHQPHHCEVSRTLYHPSHRLTFLQVRASNLLDLIYKRGQAGVTRASVTIVFDNSDKSKAPVGFEQMPEISVTRQVRSYAVQLPRPSSPVSRRIRLLSTGLAST